MTKKLYRKIFLRKYQNNYTKFLFSGKILYNYYVSIFMLNNNLKEEFSNENSESKFV